RWWAQHRKYEYAEELETDREIHVPVPRYCVQLVQSSIPGHARSTVGRRVRWIIPQHELQFERRRYLRRKHYDRRHQQAPFGVWSEDRVLADVLNHYWGQPKGWPFLLITQAESK